MPARRRLASAALLLLSLGVSATPALAAEPSAAPAAGAVAWSASMSSAVEQAALPLVAVSLGVGLVAATVAGHRSYDGS